MSSKGTIKRSTKHVSVVVVGHNQIDNLERCIRSVVAASGPNRDVSYVDYASSDHSKLVAARLNVPAYQTTQEPDHIVEIENRTWQSSPYHGRSAYILFIDAGSTLPRDFLNIAIRLIENDSEIGAVWGLEATIFRERALHAIARLTKPYRQQSKADLELLLRAKGYRLRYLAKAGNANKPLSANLAAAKLKRAAYRLNLLRDRRAKPRRTERSIATGWAMSQFNGSNHLIGAM